MKTREKRYLFEGVVNVFAVFGFGIAVGFAIGMHMGLTVGIVAGIEQTQIMLLQDGISN